MQCAYCLSKIPDEATVCAHCTRKQPLTVEQRNTRTILAIGAIVLTAVFALFGAVFSVNQEHKADVDAIVQCEHAGGILVVDRSSVQYEIEDQASGRNWSDGVKAVRLIHGCPVDVN